MHTPSSTLPRTVEQLPTLLVLPLCRLESRLFVSFVVYGSPRLLKDGVDVLQS